ncbi:MAG: sulfite exporter TauE/SafE family protein [Chloroflexota bacterium]
MFYPISCGIIVGMTSTTIFTALIVFFAGFIRAVSGFGYSLLATPLMTLVIDTKSAVIMNVFLSCVGHILALFQTWRHVDWKRAALLGLGSLTGVPLGAFLIAQLDQTTIKLVIAVLVIPFSFLVIIGRLRRFKHDSLGCVISGFIGGAIGASTSFSGPPVVLFLVNQGVVGEKFVGTIAVFFLLQSIFSIAAFSSLGMIKSDLLIQIAILVVPLFIGSYIGIKVLPKIKADIFRRLVPAVVSATAVIIIISILVKL